MKKQPNIVVFMTDQQNAETINENNVAKTPNIDKFLKNAIQFSNAFTASPHCCPSRATFFSGLFPSQHGIWNNVEVDNALSRGLFDGVTLFPEELKNQGYRTYFTGKWHISAYEGPTDRGFDVSLHEYVSNYGRMKLQNVPTSNDWEKIYDKSENIKFDDKKDFGEISKIGYPKYYQFGENENPFGDKTSVKLACDTIENYSEDDPFFMFIGTTGPHDPYYPPQEFIDLYDGIELNLPKSFDDEMKDKPNLYRRTREQFNLTREEHLESLKRYLAFVSFEDHLFGKVIDTIKAKGILEDTYIIYVTDHGDYMGAHKLWAKGLPCFKEAYNICSVIGGGDIQGKRIVKELVSLADFAPTILQLADVKSHSKMSGKSLIPFIKGETPSNWRTEIFTQTNGNEVYGIQRAVWNDKWKYVLNTFDYDELYDLENDPNEMINQINNEKYKTVIKEMCKKLWQFAKETRDTCTCPYIMVSLAPYGPGIIFES